jgi:hypothetical protein
VGPMDSRVPGPEADMSRTCFHAGSAFRHAHIRMTDRRCHTSDAYTCSQFPGDGHNSDAEPAPAAAQGIDPA